MAARLRAPDLAEPILGWRVWLVGNERGSRVRLTSMIHHCVWPARRPLRARCEGLPGPRTISEHDAPSADCRCGVYAFREVESLVRYIRPPGGLGVASRAVGLVSLWGRVVEHEDGWRAESAYPYRLWLPVPGGRLPVRRPWRERLSGLGEYGVGVEALTATMDDALPRLVAARGERTV